MKQEKEAVPKTALASIHIGRQRRPFCCDTLCAFLYRYKMRCRIRGIDAFVGAVFVRLYSQRQNSALGEVLNGVEREKRKSEQKRSQAAVSTMDQTVRIGVGGKAYGRGQLRVAERVHRKGGNVLCRVPVCERK